MRTNRLSPLGVIVGETGCWGTALHLADLFNRLRVQHRRPVGARPAQGRKL
jgi:hypothetical protein